MSHYVGPGSGVNYIRGAHQMCADNGCQWRQATAILAQAQAYINEHTGRSQMSQALWCDAGGHAFSERDPGRQRIAIAVLNEDTGEEETESRDFCSECAAKAGLLNKRKTRPAAALNGPGGDRPRADPVRIRDLEDELGMSHDG